MLTPEVHYVDFKVEAINTTGKEQKIKNNKQKKNKIIIDLDTEPIAFERAKKILISPKREANILPSNTEVPSKLKKVNQDESTKNNHSLTKRKTAILSTELPTTINNNNEDVYTSINNTLIENSKTIKRLEMYIRTLHNNIDNIAARQQLMFDKIIYET